LPIDHLEKGEKKNRRKVEGDMLPVQTYCLPPFDRLFALAACLFGGFIANKSEFIRNNKRIKMFNKYFQEPSFQPLSVR